MQVFVLTGCSEHQYHDAIRILVAAGLTSWLEWWLYFSDFHTHFLHIQIVSRLFGEQKTHEMWFEQNWIQTTGVVLKCNSNQISTDVS